MCKIIYILYIYNFTHIYIMDTLFYSYVAEPYKRVDSANEFKLNAGECAWPKTMEEDKRRDNRYNKSDDFIAGITNVYVNVRGGCM